MVAFEKITRAEKVIKEALGKDQLRNVLDKKVVARLALVHKGKTTPRQERDVMMSRVMLMTAERYSINAWNHKNCWRMCSTF